MRFLLFFFLTVPVVAPQTLTVSQAPSDLVVVKFSWTRFGPPSGGLIRSDQTRPPDGPTTVSRSPITTNPDTLKNARETQDRRADLQQHISSMTNLLKEAASARTAPGPAKLYVYQVRVKNAGARVIKSFVWEYRDAPGSPGRQFLCTEKTRPDQSKGLEALSARAPSRLVDAASAGDRTPKSQAASAVINRIEYDDGSVWLRPSWDSSILSRRVGARASNGKCVGL